MSFSLRILFALLLFFFSSRRRHTRLVSDWSSDVCSSDLIRGSNTTWPPGGAAHGRSTSRRSCAGSQVRSEERRVGKECGGRGSRQEQEKKILGRPTDEKGRESGRDVWRK